MAKVGWYIGGIAVVLVGGIALISSYNGLARENEAVNQSYAQVQNVLQRQADLIPNLVATVKGYATHEKETFVETAQARASAFQATASIDPNKLANDPELQKKYFDAQAAMIGSARSMITAVSENNPTLLASTQFTALTQELEGSQNRVAVERRRNQQTVQTYNSMIHVFPRNMIAAAFGFEPKPYFAATDSAQTAPQVKF